MSHTAPAGTGINASVPLNVQQVLGDSVRLEGLLKGQAKVFGTVHLMIGLLTLLLGIVLTLHGPSAAVLSGVYYWGSLTYIIAGSLSIAAENNLNSTSHVCLMRGSYGMNIASAVTAASAIIILSVDVGTGSWNPKCNRSSECEQMFDQLFKGISAILLMFSIMEFILSICLSAVTCKANNCCTPQIFVISNSSMPQQSAEIPPQRSDKKVNEESRVVV